VNGKCLELAEDSAPWRATILAALKRPVLLAESQLYTCLVKIQMNEIKCELTGLQYITYRIMIPDNNKYNLDTKDETPFRHAPPAPCRHRMGRHTARQETQHTIPKPPPVGQSLC
jgi:hypothetical protein